VTDRENQDTTTTTAAPAARALTVFTRQRRLTAAMALSVGVGSLVYGTVLAFPAAASSTSAASVSCSTSTASASASASATKTDTGTATATASASASSTDSASASASTSASPSASGSGTASASASATESASASATPTDCTTKTATASATPTATKTHTATATPTVKKSATAKASVTATISGKGNPPSVIDTATIPWTIPVYTYAATGQYFAYDNVPPGDASYQLPHGSITRAQIIARAQLWVQAQVPYSQTEWYTNENGTYRQDCSGYVSMAWDLDQYTDFWTGNLNLVSHTIPAAELLPGDSLMSDEHTVLFAGWANSAHTEFDYYEEAHPGTVARYVVDAPLSAFLDNGFAAFRYDGVVNSAALPTNPVAGDLYSTLAQKASEIHPPGVIYGELLGLDQSESASATNSTTQISAQVAADDVVSSEGARSEGVALGIGGAFLMGAGLLLRRPSIPLRGRRGRRGKH